MKKVIIILAAFIFLFLISFVSAAVDVKYNVYEATIKANGDIEYSNTPLNNANLVGYLCQDSSCQSVSEQIFPPTSISGNSIDITFPTTLHSSFGYGGYFYKPGYIWWEEISTWAGTGTVPPIDVFLAKKEACFAPIVDLSVLNEIEPHKPIEIYVKAEIDAKTYAAIQNAGPLDYLPPELEEEAVVETKAKLIIRDSNNDIIKEETIVFDIPFSGSEEVEFEHIFNETGKYYIEVETSVIDEKCLSTIPQKADADIRVIPEGLVDYAYTLLDNLSYIPISPEINEIIILSIDKVSNYVDEFGNLTPVPTKLTSDIYKSGILVESQSFIIPKNDNSNDFAPFSFQTILSEEGLYTVEITGIAETSLGQENLPMTHRVDFIVGNPSSTDPICGNYIIEQGEMCDDGNLIDGDGCSSSCQLDGTIACFSNADCGTDTLLGGPFCFGNGLAQTTLVHTCNNPGVLTAFCTEMNKTEIVKTCPNKCDHQKQMCFDDDEDNDDDSDGKSGGGANQFLEDLGPRTPIFTGSQQVLDDEPTLLLRNSEPEKNSWLIWAILLLILIIILIVLIVIMARSR